MKTQFKVIVLLFTLCISVNGFAQKASKDEVRISREVKERVDVMKLNEKQESQLIEIRKKFYVEKEELSKKFGSDPVLFKSKLKELNRDTNQRTDSIFTPEQIALWDQHRQTAKQQKTKK
ncbi:MAG: hypothetical protein RR346_03345 [Bacteroidales bacterium]